MELELPYPWESYINYYSLLPLKRNPHMSFGTVGFLCLASATANLDIIQKISSLTHPGHNVQPFSVGDYEGGVFEPHNQFSKKRGLAGLQFLEGGDFLHKK